MELNNTTYNLNGLIINKSPIDRCFRMVHDGVDVLSIVESTGHTETRNNMICYTTEEECLLKIIELNLNNNIIIVYYHDIY